MPRFTPLSPKTLPVNIVGGTKFARYSQMTTEKTVNMLVTGQDSGVSALVNFSGYEEVLDFLSGEARGIFLSTRLNELIVVFGNKVYVVTSFLVSRLVGTLNSTSGPVHIAENFNSEIAIEDGSEIYIYNYSTSSFTPVITPFIPVYIDFQDGYFIATGDDGSWYLSKINDGLTWSPLDKETLQTKADILQSVVVLDRQVWVLGQKAGEIWYDQALPPPLFPYARENSLAIDYGALSRETIAEGFGMLVWLAKNEKSNPTIVFTNGGKPKNISTEGLDSMLAELTTPEDSVGFLFQQDGHIFYQLTFNTDNFSIVYDFNTKMFYTLTNENLDRHIAKSVVLFNNKLYFISFIDSKIYEMSTEITTYNGKVIPRIRISKPYRFPNSQIFIVNRLNVQMELGFTPPTPGLDDLTPLLSLSISKDDGSTYGNVVSHPLNTLGVRRGQVNFWRLGRADNFTFQFRFWSTGSVVVTNSSMDIYS